MRKETNVSREQQRNLLQRLRDGPVGKAVDKAIDRTDRFLGPSGKAWLANGLDELRQAAALGTEQVQAGNNPGLWGTITTGEATAERMAGDRQAALQASYEVPKTMTLAEMRGFSRDRANENEAGRRMEHSQERGGMEM
jgi:hypothetical protein